MVLLIFRIIKLTPVQIVSGMNPHHRLISCPPAAPAASAFFLALGILVMAPLFSSPLFAQDPKEIGFIERFALAENREEVLKELIPGTEDFYFFHALHYQNTGNRAELEKVIDQWKKRFENSGLRKEIENMIDPALRKERDRSSS